MFKKIDKFFKTNLFKIFLVIYIIILLLTFIPSTNTNLLNNKLDNTSTKQISDFKQTNFKVIEKSKKTNNITNKTQKIKNKQNINPEQYPKLQLKLHSAKVIYIYDGDTIKVKSNNHFYKVRYIGIDTPELKYEYCIANKAKLINLYLTKNRTVYLAKDVRETDKYGRLLRFVFVKLSDLQKDKHLPKSLKIAIKNSKAKYSSKYGNLLFVNQFLVEQGWARTLTIPPDIKFSNIFIKLEQHARQYNIGIFNPNLCKKKLSSSNHNYNYKKINLNINQCTNIICSYNAYNCSDFSTYAQAYKAYKCCMQQIGYDIHRLDGDNDGIPCEKLR